MAAWAGSFPSLEGVLPWTAGTAMMIDAHRWSRELAERYATSGLVTDVLLTHRDHAAHGRRYADYFGARLWIHQGDLDAAPDADQVMAASAGRTHGPARAPANRLHGRPLVSD